MAILKKGKTVVVASYEELPFGEYKRLIKLTFENKSTLLVTEKGIIARVTRRSLPVRITWDELAIALQVAERGQYIKSKKEKAIPPSTKVLGILANKL